MVRKPQSANWALAGAERSLKVALLAYAGVIVLVFAYRAWAASGLPRLGTFEGTSWLLAGTLALLGLGYVRSQRERIARGERPLSSWPAAVLALCGVFTSAVYLLLLAIGWFEVYQARSAYELVPGRDRSAPAA